MSRDRFYAQLHALASVQFGLVTWAQLTTIGLVGEQIRRLVADGRLVRVRRGVYRVCGVAPSWHGSVLAAVLAAGAGAFASHETAAAVWGLLDPRKLPGPIHLIAPGARHLDGVAAHRQRLAPDETATYRRVPVTTVERTLIDLASSRYAGELGRLCDEGIRAGILSTRRLAALVERHAGPGRRRLTPIHDVLADRPVGYDPGANVWELAMDRMWDAMGLPPARRQYRLRIGGRQYKIDRAIVELKIAVEWNGFDPHGTRSAFDQDSNRRAVLITAGWIPLDFTSRSDPALVCRAVLAAVEQRRSGLWVPASGRTG